MGGGVSMKKNRNEIVVCVIQLQNLCYEINIHLFTKNKKV